MDKFKLRFKLNVISAAHEYIYDIIKERKIGTLLELLNAMSEIQSEAFKELDKEEKI